MALPLNQVEHIHRLDGKQETSLSPNGSLLVYREEMIPWQPLWGLLGEASLYEELDTLAETLPLRRQDHIAWMDALEYSLRYDAPFDKARNPHECAFGRWYDAYHPENEWLKLHLTLFESPHSRIHTLADKLLKLAATGQQEQALTLFYEEKADTLAHLLHLFDLLQGLLPRLKRTVALIVIDGSSKYALGLDKVVGICTVEPNAIRPTQGNIGARAPRGFVTGTAVEGLIPVLDVAQLLDKGSTT